MARNDLTSKIERLGAFEERLGVELRSLSAFGEKLDEDYDLEVMGELHPTDGTTLQSDIQLSVAVYDSDDRVIGEAKDFFDADDFFGFQVFSIGQLLPNVNVTKIRIFPTTQ